MFGTSILDYRERLQIAKHGFESVTLKLARDYDRYKAIAERHGIDISARRVRHVLDQVERDRGRALGLAARARADDGGAAAHLAGVAPTSRPPTPTPERRRSADPHPPLDAEPAAVEEVGDRAHLRPALGAQQARLELLPQRLGAVVPRDL